MPGAEDLITEFNVINTFTMGKYICFKLKNGFTVKLDPNKVSKDGKRGT